MAHSRVWRWSCGFGFFLLCGVSLSQQSFQAQTTGGTLEWSFNADVLSSLGAKLDTRGITAERYIPAHSGRYVTLITHIAKTSGLSVARNGNHIEGLTGGLIELHDGPLLLVTGGTADLRQARLRVDAPPSFALVVTDRSGDIWATLDRPHYGFRSGDHEFWMNDFDLRVGPALATLLKDRSLVGQIIGSASFTLPVTNTHVVMETPIAPDCAIRWPTPESPADLRMIMLDHDPELGGLADSVAVMRCGIPTNDGFSTCTPSSRDGLVVIAPDAAVKNLGDRAIAWYPMFSKPSPPYGNDQHPFLIWNLYRIDPDGTFRQIGRSGLKHAYYADNFSCPCKPQSVAYPQCEETYGAGTNDVLNFLGPRDEVIPATGQWGRCGSDFDPNCSGRLNPNYGKHDDGYRYRLAVRESDLLPDSNVGALYLFEYEYVVRDQLDPEHGTAHRLVTPEKSSSRGGILWTMTPTSFDNGPAINSWVDPAHPVEGSINKRVVTPNGRFRVAVRTTRIHSGRYRYDYAVYNEDFSLATTSGTPANLRITAEVGLNEFEVPLQSPSRVHDLEFVDADYDRSNDWQPSVANGELAWKAPKGASLQWGSAYSFSFTSAFKPTLGEVLLRAKQPNADGGLSYAAQVLVPSSTQATKNGNFP